MVDLRKWDTKTLIRCDNRKCGEVSFQQEFEENDWKCPHCGKPFPRPE